MMNEAQGAWKVIWHDRKAIRYPRHWQKQIRREAALERKLAAAQRRIAELEGYIDQHNRRVLNDKPLDEWEKTHAFRGVMGDWRR